MWWDTAWRCLVDRISRVYISGSRSDRYHYDTFDIMTCTSIIQNEPFLTVTPKIEDDDGLCRRMQRGAICLCFGSIHQSLVRPALDGCDSVLVQIKFPRDREGWSVTPGGWEGMGCLEKEKKEVLLPQQKVTSPVMDGPWRKNPLISLDELFYHPATHFASFF